MNYEYRAARFGSENVVRQKIIVNNYPMMIVGVSAPGFTGLVTARSSQGARIPIQMKPLVPVVKWKLLHGFGRAFGTRGLCS